MISDYGVGFEILELKYWNFGNDFARIIVMLIIVMLIIVHHLLLIMARIIVQC